MSKTLLLPAAQTGIIFTLIFTSSIVFTLTGGVLSNSFSKKNILLVSMASLSGLLMLIPAMHNVAAIYIIIFLMGGFGGIIQSLSSALVADVNPENTSFYVNFTQVFFGIGAVIGPVFAGLLISFSVIWQYYYLAIGITSTIITILFMLVKADKKINADKMTWKSFTSIIADKRFLLICIAMLLYAGSEVGSWGWMSNSLTKTHSFSPLKSSIAVAVFWSAMTVGRILCGYLTLKFSEKQIIIRLALASIALVIMSALPLPEALTWCVLAAMGLGFSGQWALIASYGGKHSNGPSGTVFPIMVASGCIGVTIIPYLMGILASYSNVNIAMGAPSILFLVIAVIFIFIKSPS
ncbi:MAG TPA: MFS transporter [Clostridia bacterium]